jgi:MFS family permease
MGIGLMAVAMGIYGIASDWRALIPAVILISLSRRCTDTGCSVLCADQLKDHDRATGKSLCNTIASLFLAFSPMLGAGLVSRLGGLNAEGLRPLYHLQCIGYALILLYVVIRLREPVRSRLAGGRRGAGVFDDFRRVFRDAPHLKWWIAVACLSRLPVAMALPFMHVFAKEVKGAGQYTLGMMSVMMVAAHILFGIPLGRLADRLGRKRVIYLLTPVWYLSGLMVVTARGPATLMLAGALWGFYPIMSVVTSSMSLELVPLKCMGRWSGVLGTFAGLVTVPAPLLAGLIWRHVGPAYVFVIPIALDLALRLPLLTMVPETLWRQDL